MVGMSIEDKIKVQQRVIDNFQSEKEALLEQISCLEKANTELRDEQNAAAQSAKEWIDTIDKEFEDFESLVREFMEYKQKYKDMFVQLSELKKHYEQALKQMLDTTRESAVNMGTMKKPSIIDKLRNK